MARWLVETELVVHAKVEVTVDATTADDAEELALSALPQTYHDMKSLKASVVFSAASGLQLRTKKITSIVLASGHEKVKKALS